LEFWLEVLRIGRWEVFEEREERRGQYFSE
jgi:hypothetical protein